jgi:YVTN family beta-propeller protein
VTNVNDNTVSILDVVGRSVLATVPVTGLQPYAVEITADSALAIVGVVNDAVTSAISVIDLNTFTEVRSIPTGSQGALGAFFTPEVGVFGNLFTEFAMSPDSTTLVLPDRPNAQVALYNVLTGAQIAVLPTPALPTAVDIDPVGLLAVVSHEGSNQAITRIDLSTSSLLGGPIAVGDNLVNQVIRLTPSASHAIVAVSNAVRFVDLVTGVVDAPISTGTVGDIGITFDGQYAVVSNFNARIIDIASRSLVRTIPVQPAYELALSPNAHVAVEINNRFRENLVFLGTNGVSGSLLGVIRSGAPAEGDGTRQLALSPDGNTLIACNIVSENVTIVDLPSGARSYVDTGDRCWDARVTADGQYAVVTNTDASTVSVIDLSTNTRVANLPVATRPTEVRLSPDGSVAYVTTVAGTDRLAILDLAGPASALTTSLPTGQLGTTTRGTAISSGLEISGDGATVAVCVSFDDQLMLVDTATRTEVARVPVGDFPLRAAFSPDGTVAYVTNTFGDSVSVVLVAGASSSVLATIPSIEAAFEVIVSPDGAFTYVSSYDFQNPSLFVLANATNTVAATVPLPGLPNSMVYSAVDDVLYVGLSSGEVARVAAAGAGSVLLDATAISNSPTDLVFSESLRRTYTAQPGADDGADVVAFGGLFETYGAGSPGTGGVVPQISGVGIPSCGQPVSIVTSAGRPSGVGTYLVGLAPLNVNLLNFTVLVDPLIEIPHALDGAGSFTLPLVLPNDPALVGVDVYLQGAYIDTGAPFNIALTAGLAMRIR